MVNLLDMIGWDQINNPGLWSLHIHQKFLTAEEVLPLGKQITKLYNVCVVHFCSYDSQNLSDEESLVIMSNFLNFKINFLKFQKAYLSSYC